MREVVMEVESPAKGWVRVGSVGEAEPPGSISSYDGGRTVFVFGWHWDIPGVWCSIAGIDTESPAVREILSLELALLSDLAEPFLLRIVNQAGIAMRLRFTLG